MQRRMVLVSVAALPVLAACGVQSKFRSYDGPPVTRVVVSKSDRRLWLFNNDRVLEQYSIALGFAPVGHKQFEGDGKTPEGWYTIDRRNPNSRYHLSIGISYPNEADIAYAKAQGKDPGGDIFIHGRNLYRGRNTGDWTAGCIAVTDREIEDIYAMVPDGTPILLQA